MSRRVLALVALLIAGLLPLSACGRKGWPQPPGPPDQIIYPRVYPTR
ncbi:MAG: hypothetical protein QM753_11555 [Thermomicrobiales bacterium]